jgi:hypothetical protein
MLKMRILAGIAMFLAFCAAPKAQDQKAGASNLPDRFEIGRRTYFDFGPPFNYYEIMVIRPAADGTATVARVLLTPPGNACMVPAKAEFAEARLDAAVGDLLKPVNPCTIPERDLHREEKRCKHCSNFSGAEVSMQVPCGSRSRVISAKVLEKDWFDKAPDTPKNTLRTLELLQRLDKAIGPGVMEKPAFQVGIDTGPPAEIPDPEILSDLTAGKYDGLFSGAPDKPSALYVASQKRPPAPVVRVVTVEPISPDVIVQPQYSPIARLANVEGVVSVSFEVQENGMPGILVLEGEPLLYGVVRTAVESWKFPAAATGRQIRATIEFKSNCTSPTP